LRNSPLPGAASSKSIWRPSDRITGASGVGRSTHFGSAEAQLNHWKLAAPSQPYSRPRRVPNFTGLFCPIDALTIRLSKHQTILLLRTSGGAPRVHSEVGELDREALRTWIAAALRGTPGVLTLAGFA
jgi:hypothetical protein